MGEKNISNIILIGILILTFSIASIGVGIAQPQNNQANQTPNNQSNPQIQGDIGILETTITSFSNTRPVTEVNPESLSGKIRVEQAFLDDTSVELIRNTSTNYTLNINVTGNAKNVTFYLQQQAVISSLNITNLEDYVTMYLDGEQHSFITTKAGPGNSPWIAFNIEKFSTRTITFNVDEQIQNQDDTETENQQNQTPQNNTEETQQQPGLGYIIALIGIMLSFITIYSKRNKN